MLMVFFRLVLTQFAGKQVTYDRCLKWMEHNIAIISLYQVAHMFHTSQAFSTSYSPEICRSRKNCIYLSNVAEETHHLWSKRPPLNPTAVWEPLFLNIIMQQTTKGFHMNVCTNPKPLPSSKPDWILFSYWWNMFLRALRLRLCLGLLLCSCSEVCWNSSDISFLVLSPGSRFRSEAEAACLQVFPLSFTSLLSVFGHWAPEVWPEKRVC